MTKLNLLYVTASVEMKVKDDSAWDMAVPMIFRTKFRFSSYNSSRLSQVSRISIGTTYLYLTRRRRYGTEARRRRGLRLVIEE